VPVEWAPGRLAHPNVIRGAVAAEIAINKTALGFNDLEVNRG
jgi:hypothetical protein